MAMKVTDLVKLGQQALEMLDSYIKEKNIEPPTRVCIRHFTTELKISETGCSSQ